MLSDAQIASYHENGFLRIPDAYTAEEVEHLRADMNWMIETWAEVESGWSGPWRKELMDSETEAKSKLVSMHDLHFYAQSWMSAITKPSVAEAMSQLLTGDADGPEGAPVEVHHSTMHVKPPETGHPFPMHQDWAFYKHADDRYIDALVHLDDTSHANGEIRFLKGSHKSGPARSYHVAHQRERRSRRMLTAAVAIRIPAEGHRGSSCKGGRSGAFQHKHRARQPYKLHRGHAPNGPGGLQAPCESANRRTVLGQTRCDHQGAASPARWPALV